MGGRIENERIATVVTKSPLRKHSMGQRTLAGSLEGQKRLEIPRKQRMSENRRLNKQQEAKEYERAKVERIAQRVQAYFEGYDGFSFEVFKREMNFLEQKCPTIVASAFLHNTGEPIGSQILPAISLSALMRASIGG